VQYLYRLLILIVVGVISMPLTSLASEGNGDTECPKKKNNQPEDSVNIYDAENKGIEDVQAPTLAKKKPVAKTQARKPNYKTYNAEFEESDKLGAENPNSAMSFNFIYYIIDKFKFTDPLE
jgi:hypothetical protein